MSFFTSLVRNILSPQRTISRGCSQQKYRFSLQEGPRKLTPAFVQNKYISADRVSAILTIAVASFIPYVGLFLTTGKGFVTCNALALLLPATWQLLWLSSQLVAPAVEGHQRAFNAHRAAAAASFAWHAVVVLLILKDRSLPRRFAALWRDTPLYLTPVKALAADLVVVIAGGLFWSVPVAAYFVFLQECHSLMEAFGSLSTVL
jgi:hypothetical protein